MYKRTYAPGKRPSCVGFGYSSPIHTRQRSWVGASDMHGVHTTLAKATGSARHIPPSSKVMNPNWTAGQPFLCRPSNTPLAQGQLFARSDPPESFRRLKYPRMEGRALSQHVRPCGAFNDRALCSAIECRCPGFSSWRTFATSAFITCCLQ